MIDLIKGINLEIAGELGKFNSLPIDALVKISQTLQNLINTLAKTDLDTNKPIDLSNFKLELSSFRPGSAVPGFKFTERTQTILGSDVLRQRKSINKSVDGLLKISNTGEYSKLTKKYSDPVARNSVVNGLFDFVNSFQNSPVAVMELTKGPGKPLYKLKRFKPEVKRAILADIKISGELSVDEGYGIARVKIFSKGGKKINRIQKVYSDNETKIAYSLDSIVHGERVYTLSWPLMSELTKEEDYFVIKNQAIDIIGTGETEEDAEKAFAEEFDFIYTRYNELPDSELTIRIRKIKSLLALLVKNVE